jgi:hypothetical protein
MVGGLWLLEEGFEDLPAGEADVMVVPDGAMEVYAREGAEWSVGGAKVTGGAAMVVMA